MTDQGLVLAPQAVKVSFALEPYLIAVDDLLVLSSFDNQSGFPAWVYETKAALSPERSHLHDLLVKGLKILEHDTIWPDLPAYIEYLEEREADDLRDQAIDWMSKPEKAAHYGLEPVDHDRVLADVNLYIEMQEGVRRHWQEHYGYKDIEPLDLDFLAEVHAMLQKPERLKASAIEHLRYMWDEALEAEWKRSLPMLEESVAAFQALDMAGLSPMEAIRMVTGREITGYWEEELVPLESLIFVPSAHLGPYVRLFTHDDRSVAHLMYGARLPEGTRVQSAALNRSEMLMRLSALADDTRLQILKLLTLHEELCAQDIMVELDLSQSSASRHLRQLAATGYIVERRRDVAKCYSLNMERVEDTLQALRRYLKTS